MRSVSRITSANAGQVLRTDGLITAEQLDDVQREAQQTGERVADVLFARGLVTEHDLAKSMVRQASMPYVSPRTYDIDKDALAALPAAAAHQHRVLPLDLFGDILVLATWCELDPHAVAEMETDTGKRLAFVIAEKTELETILNERYPQQDLGKAVANRLDQLFGG